MHNSKKLYRYAIIRNSKQINNPGREVTKEEFQIFRSQGSKSVCQYTPLKEEFLYTTKPIRAFIEKKEGKKMKLSFNSQSPDIPDWAKHKESNISPAKESVITLIGANGWVTVTPTHKNKVNAIEKNALSSAAADLLKPEWMHKKQRIISPLLQFKRVAPISSLKSGTNMCYLIDKVPLPKSNFSFMDYRHNVMTKEDAYQFSQTNQNIIKRPYEWLEPK